MKKLRVTKLTCQKAKTNEEAESQAMSEGILPIGSPMKNLR